MSINEVTRNQTYYRSILSVPIDNNIMSFYSSPGYQRIFKQNNSVEVDFNA